MHEHRLALRAVMDDHKGLTAWFQDSAGLHAENFLAHISVGHIQSGINVHAPGLDNVAAVQGNEEVDNTGYEEQNTSSHDPGLERKWNAKNFDLACLSAGTLLFLLLLAPRARPRDISRFVRSVLSVDRLRRRRRHGPLFLRFRRNDRYLSARSTANAPALELLLNPKPFAAGARKMDSHCGRSADVFLGRIMILALILASSRVLHPVWREYLLSCPSSS